MIERIEALLLSRGVNKRSVKRELANTCGISYQAVQAWFNENTKSIDAKHLSAIADAYGTSVDELLTGTPPTHRNSSSNGPALKVVGEINKFVNDDFVNYVSYASIGGADQYVLVMKNSDFFPRFRQGDRLLIDSKRKPHQNDDVLITNTDNTIELGYVFQVDQDSLVIMDKGNAQKTIRISEVKKVEAVAAIIGNGSLDVSGLKKKPSEPEDKSELGMLITDRKAKSW